MRQEKDFMGLPVRSLQLMLGSLAQGRPGLAQLVPDGIFGEATLEAVMRFQREHGLAVTGRVDLETWEAVAAAYRAALPGLAPPRPVQVIRERSFAIRSGQCCLHLFLIQSMFLALSQVLDGVEAAPVNGRHTGSSVRNATWLQRCCGLPETGILDLATWNMLTRTYELFISRSDLPGGYRQEPPLGQNPSQPLRNFPWEPWGRGG